MAIEIVSFPIKNGGSFHSYVKLPEGTYHKSHVIGGSRGRDHGPVGQRSAPVAGVVAAPRFPVLAPTKRLEKPGLAKWVPRPDWDDNYCIHAQKIVYLINIYIIIIIIIKYIYMCV